MFNRVKSYIAENNMINPNDHIIAGVSGGADSVCLFFILLNLMKEIPFTMQVVHVNHKLRDEAGEDAAFVADLCRKHGIEYKIFEKDIAAVAKEQGLSLEEAGREYRYECFHEMIRNIETDKIAVAHHQNDRAETILFNLFRGSGLRGLSGIRPVRDNIIRPLLCATRQEIEDYLRSEGLSYRTDPTNAEDIYTRNHIRHNIIPFANEINSEAVRHMAKTAELVWEAESYLHKHTKIAFDECVTLPPGQKKIRLIKINLIKLNKQDIIIKKRILLMVFEKLLPGRVNIKAGHIETLTGLTITGGSRRISLPNGLIAEKEYDVLTIGFADKELVKFRSKEDDLSYKIDLNKQEMVIPGLGLVSYRTFPYQEKENIPQKTYTKWFDYDKITSCVLFRHRRAGDYLSINREGQHKKLKNYLINEKVPKAKRDELFVLADGSHVLWVPGFRISEFYKVTNDTKTVLEVELSLRN